MINSGDWHQEKHSAMLKFVAVTYQGESGNWLILVLMVPAAQINYFNKSSALPEMGDRLATVDMGRKVGGGCCARVPFHGAAGSLSNTMLPGPRPTSVPSGILIHLTVWPQYTDVTDRQNPVA